MAWGGGRAARAQRGAHAAGAKGEGEYSQLARTHHTRNRKAARPAPPCETWHGCVNGGARAARCYMPAVCGCNGRGAATSAAPRSIVRYGLARARPGVQRMRVPPHPVSVGSARGYDSTCPHPHASARACARVGSTVRTPDLRAHAVLAPSMEQVVLRERVSFDSFTCTWAHCTPARSLSIAPAARTRTRVARGAHVRAVLYRAVDYDDRSLVVHYDQESLLGSATGVISGSRVEPHKKRIRLTSLTPTTNIPQLADAIMRSCTIIPPEQRSALVEALLELQHAGAAGAGQEPPAAPATRRVADVGPGAMGATSYSSRNREAPTLAVAASSRAAGVPTGSAARGSSAGGGKEAEEAAEENVDEGSDDEPVRLADVDTYLEALYEDDMALKIAGAKRLLALAKMPANLPALIDNTTLLGALARVLREDWRKSGDL
ncbi:hypothetical protein EON68_00960, partial [archaeon]